MQLCSSGNGGKSGMLRESMRFGYITCRITAHGREKSRHPSIFAFDSTVTKNSNTESILGIGQHKVEIIIH